MFSNPNSTKNVSHDRPSTSERDQCLTLESSSPICIDIQENFQKYQKTPKDLFRIITRPSNPNSRPEIRRPLVTLPFTVHNRNPGSLQLKTQENISQKSEKNTPQTPDESKEKAISVTATENSKQKSGEKYEPEQCDIDTLFENFEKYFKIKFPIEGQPDIHNLQKHSPHKISRTLIFDEVDEGPTTTQLANRRLKRDRSRQDLISNFQNNASSETSHQLNLSLKDEPELPPLKQAHRPTINCLSKNYSLHNPAALAESKESKSTQFSRLEREVSKLTPIIPMPKLEKQKEPFAFYIHNEFFFANLEPNESYQIYNKDPFHSTRSSNNYGNDSSNFFEKARERLGVFNPANNQRNRSRNVSINNNKSYISNETDTQCDGVEIDIRGNIPKRKRNFTQNVGLQALKDNFDNKENQVLRNPSMGQVDNSTKDLRKASSSNNHSVNENRPLKLSAGPVVKETQGGFKISNQVGGKNTLALKDITNFSIRRHQEGVSLARNLIKPGEKNTLLNTGNIDSIPKAAYEVLPINRPKYQKFDISKVFQQAESTKRSVSAPRRIY